MTDENKMVDINDDVCPYNMTVTPDGDKHVIMLHFDSVAVTKKVSVIIDNVDFVDDKLRLDVSFAEEFKEYEGSIVIDELYAEISTCVLDNIVKMLEHEEGKLDNG